MHGQQNIKSMWKDLTAFIISYNTDVTITEKTETPSILHKAQLYEQEVCTSYIILAK
jgi:hypothetical protein